MSPSHLAALQALIGLVLAAAGAAWYSPPAGLIVAGAGLVALALWPTRRPAP